jgi:sec-independent protein translocase protein TatB
MFSIGWTELLVVAIVLIVVVGPKDLPPMLRAFGKMTSNLRKMAGDFRTQFDEALREADIEDVRKTISDAKSLNPANSLRDAINPLRQMGQDIRNDLQKATQMPSSPTPVGADVEAQHAVEGAPVVNTAAEVQEVAAAPVMPVTASPMAAPTYFGAVPAPTATTSHAMTPATNTPADPVPAKKTRAPKTVVSGAAAALAEPAASRRSTNAEISAVLATPVEKSKRVRVAKVVVSAPETTETAVKPAVTRKRSPHRPVDTPKDDA